MGELSEATEPSIFTLLLVCYLTAGVTESAHVCHTELHMPMRIRAVRRYVLPTCQNQLSVTGCSYQVVYLLVTVIYLQATAAGQRHVRR